MDPRLLRYYNLELQHLRETGAEFAQEFPKIAARLGMQGLQVADPYVERILEGVAFLAARVQLKLDAEFPRFTQALLEIVYPHYLAPTPSMLIAQLRPDLNDANLATGPRVPAGTAMFSAAPADDATSCEFRLAHEVRLWPIEITGVSYFSFAPDLPLDSVPTTERVAGGLRIRLRSTAGLKFSQIAAEALTFHLLGREDVANQLYELCLGSAIGVMVLSGKGAARRHDVLAASSLTPVGFDDAEALLPVTLRSFSGYRLLQEYFAFPQRFRFFALNDLAGPLRRIDGDQAELVVLFRRGEAALETMVDATNLGLGCTPAINLFHKRADRIHVTDDSYEYHVVPDRTRPLDFEVYSVTDIVGHGAGSDEERRFLPLYSAYAAQSPDEQDAYFTTRREPRLIPAAVRRRGTRSSYGGSELFLSLVDSRQAPFGGDLRQLSVQTMCTNRDLPLQIATSAGLTDFSLDAAAPVSSIRTVSGPTRPQAPLAEGSVSWRAINHLSLNYLSLVQSTPDSGAAALRELLGLYASDADSSAKRQIEGLRSVSVARVVRRLPAGSPDAVRDRDKGKAPLAFGRGLEISVLLEELAFEGGSGFLFGAVLDQYFARHVSINSFTETVLRSERRGEINRWSPHWGARPTL